MSMTILMSSPSESSFLGGGTGDNGRGCDRDIDLFTIKYDYHRFITSTTTASHLLISY